MANNEVQKFTPGLLPTASRKAQEEAGFTDRFQGGLFSQFNQLVMQGRMWAFKVGKNVAPFVDEISRRPIPVDVVLIDSHPGIAKRYYIKGYTEGEDNQPDCFSSDAVRPSERSQFKQSATCGGCRWNELRSARNADGSQREGKACQDKKILSIMFASDLIGGAIGPVQLQLPYTSHANLSAYLNYLKGNGYAPNTVITQLDFDYSANLNYPKVTFNPKGALTDEQIDSAKAWRNDPRSQRIVATDDRSMPLDPGSKPSAEAGSGPTIYAEALNLAPQPAGKPAQARPPVTPVVDTQPEPEPASEAPSRTDGPLPGLVALNVPNMPGAYLDPQSHQVVNEDGTPYLKEEPKQAPSFQGTVPAAAAPIEQKKTRARRATAAGEPKASNGTEAEKPADAPLPETEETLSEMIARLSKLMPPPQG